jgi:hypothetical protein
MLATRAFTHLFQGEAAEAADWAQRAAAAPGAHVLIAMIAAVCHALAGDDARARRWAANVRARSPGLVREDFFGAFPIRDQTVRTRIATALARLRF